MSHMQSLEAVLRRTSQSRDLVTETLPPALFTRAVEAWIGDDPLSLPSSALLLVRIDWEIGLGLPVRPAHAEAAQTLRDVATIIGASLRSTDIIGRIDDDTLGVLLPSTPSHQAIPVSRRLRASVSERSCRTGRGVTVSIGVASPRSPSLWRDAESALSQARREGGDRTVIVDAATERRAA